MLNRRTIRIKIMQSLFAYSQCKDADLLLAHDLIEERFQPDLNSMEGKTKNYCARKRNQPCNFSKRK